MVKQVMKINDLAEFISNTYGTSEVLVEKNNSVLTIEPTIEKKSGCCSRVRGLLTDCPDMSVEKFLERKHKDRELDL
jgi:hypothetical protein